MNVKQLKEYIIEPTLRELNKYSKSAVNLLLGTAAQESHCGEYIHQINGPALGIYQCEPATLKDMIANYLRHKYELRALIIKTSGIDYNECETPELLIYNLKYSTAICRCHYLRVKEPMPKDPNDIEALGTYWKKYYNTILGKGSVKEFIDNYKKYIK